MKILWITNGPFSHHFSLLGEKIPVQSSGSWLSAAYDKSLNDGDIELHIATVSTIIKPLSGKFAGVSFYVLPGGSIFNYDLESKRNRQYWEDLKKEVKPDLMISWGTEARFGYLAMQVFSDIPKIIYVQGVLNSIIHHLDDGVPSSVKKSTLRDYIDVIRGDKQVNDFTKQARIEKEMFKLAYGAIVENDWCESQCKALNNKLHVFYNKLPIRKEYFEKVWCADKVEQHSIFTNAGGVAYKGHHILFQAVSIVKAFYPDVRLYVPGACYLEETKDIKHRTGYFNWLHKLYNENNLQENIHFTGNLTAIEMATHISKCNVYVMPSMIENHSSSLIEAMIVGAPCISSLVGGVASLINHSVNGYLYNSLEPSTLAGYIMRLFEEQEICQSFSEKTRMIINKRNTDFGEEMKIIYNLVK